LFSDLQNIFSSSSISFCPTTISFHNAFSGWHTNVRAAWRRRRLRLPFMRATNVHFRTAFLQSYCRRCAKWYIERSWNTVSWLSVHFVSFVVF